MPEHLATCRPLQAAEHNSEPEPQAKWYLLFQRKRIRVRIEERGTRRREVTAQLPCPGDAATSNTPPGCSSTCKVEVGKRGIIILLCPVMCCSGELLCVTQQGPPQRALVAVFRRQWLCRGLPGCSLWERASPSVQLGPQRPSDASSLSSIAEDLNCWASTTQQPIICCRYSIPAVLELFTIHMQWLKPPLNYPCPNHNL